MAGSMSGGGVQFSQTYVPGPPGAMNPSATVGSLPPQPWVRSTLDARRMMYNRTPNSDFPAGYLGTISSRRGDRMLDSLKARVNQKSYQRGVHAGERVDPGDYLWPDDMNPLDGCIREATTGLRHAPRLEYFQPTPTVEGSLAPRGAESILTIDVHRAAQLAMLKPKFGLPSRRQPPFQG